MTEESRVIFDWTSVGVTVAALAEWLPAVSAALSVIWLTLRIIQTVQELRRK